MHHRRHGALTEQASHPATRSLHLSAGGRVATATAAFSDARRCRSSHTSPSSTIKIHTKKHRGVDGVSFRFVTKDCWAMCCLCLRAGDAVQEARQASRVRPSSLRDRHALPGCLVRTHGELAWIPSPSPFSFVCLCGRLTRSCRAGQHCAPRGGRYPARREQGNEHCVRRALSV